MRTTIASLCILDHKTKYMSQWVFRMIIYIFRLSFLFFYYKYPCVMISNTLNANAIVWNVLFNLFKTMQQYATTHDPNLFEFGHLSIPGVISITSLITCFQVNTGNINLCHGCQFPIFHYFVTIIFNLRKHLNIRSHFRVWSTIAIHCGSLHNSKWKGNPRGVRIDTFVCTCLFPHWHNCLAENIMDITGTWIDTKQLFHHGPPCCLLAYYPSAQKKKFHRHYSQHVQWIQSGISADNVTNTALQTSRTSEE